MLRVHTMIPLKFSLYYYALAYYCNIQRDFSLPVEASCRFSHVIEMLFIQPFKLFITLNDLTYYFNIINIFPLT